MNEKVGVDEDKASLADEAQLDGMTSLEYGSNGAGESPKQLNNLGRGRGPVRLFSHYDFKAKSPRMTRPSATGQSSTSVVGVDEGKAFLPHEAQLNGMTSLEYGSDGAGESPKQLNNLGRGRGPAGLFSHHDFKTKSPRMTRSSAMGQSSRTRGLCRDMYGINALNLDVVKPQFSPTAALEFGRNKTQRGQEMQLASLNELRRVTFPEKLRQETRMDVPDVKSDSSSSVASSVTALKFFEFVCDDCGSSVEDSPCEGAPTCISLNLGSADDNDSVGSFSSVAELSLIHI